MSTYHLQSVFRPQSVAVIGGSPRERSAGRAVMRNLRGTGFPGKVAWINPRHAEIDWHRTIRANLRHYQPGLKTVVPETRVGYGRRRSSLWSYPQLRVGAGARKRSPALFPS